MKDLIPKLLSIPMCSLSVGVAYSADAPDSRIRIAAISALPVTDLPKTPIRTVGATESPPYSVAAPLPRVAAPQATLSQQSPTVTTSARTTLDLRPPDLRSMPRTSSFPASTTAHSDEPQAFMVMTAALPRDETSNTSLPLTGIGSFYQAALHPTRAWRILIPRQADDEFGAYMDTRTRCSVFQTTPGGRPACP